MCFRRAVTIGSFEEGEENYRYYYLYNYYDNNKLIGICRLDKELSPYVAKNGKWIVVKDEWDDEVYSDGVCYYVKKIKTPFVKKALENLGEQFPKDERLYCEENKESLIPEKYFDKELCNRVTNNIYIKKKEK